MSPDPSAYHVPVLAGAVGQMLQGGSRLADCTLGGGGHTAQALEAGLAVLGIDRDPAAIAAARARLGETAVQYLRAPYSSERALEAITSFHPDRILLDLGVSSRQLDDETRGFSFRPGAPLDMRMGGDGPDAADWLNRAPEAELRRVFAEYGDERRAARLAREITRRRQHGRFETSDDLVNAIRAVLGPRSGPADFARLFQAVRIAVNDELEGLGRALPRFLEALVPGGRLAVISYHSGEDRIVKHFFREWARACICPPELPACRCRGRPLGTLEPRRPIRPDQAEIHHNPRARSATLRIFHKAEA